MTRIPYRTLQGLLALLVLALPLGCSDATGHDAPDGRAQQPDAQLLLPDAGASYSYFGHALAATDEWLAVGAWGDGKVARNAGAVYLFRREDGGWSPHAVLRPPDAPAGGRFGYALELDERELFVGAPRAGAGAVYRYTLADGVWAPREVLGPGDAATRNFGADLALDGDTLAVAAPSGEAGSVTLFRRSGEAFRLEATLTSGPAEGEALFGATVALSGSHLAVGAPTPAPIESGAVHLYAHRDGAWEAAGTLAAPEPGDEFGAALAASGTTLVVGAPRRSAAHVYERSEGGWRLAGTLRSGEGGSDFHGASLALEGPSLAVGAPGHDAGAPHAGRVLLYRHDGDGWRLERTAGPADPRPDLSFGVAVAVLRDALLIGATGDDARGVAAGAAVVVPLADGAP